MANREDKPNTSKSFGAESFKMTFSDLTRFIKPFDGDRNKLTSFIRNCENALNLVHSTHSDILFQFILSQLEGKADAVCSLKVFDNWSELKQFLKSNFGETKHRSHLLLDLQNCKMKSNETILQYSTRLEIFLTRLQTDISHSTKDPGEVKGRLADTEDLALHTFLLGLPSHISNILRCRDPKNLAEAINLAIQEEKFYNFAQSSKGPTEPRPKCRFCGKTGHTDRSCFSNRVRPIHNSSHTQFSHSVNLHKKQLPSQNSHTQNNTIARQNSLPFSSPNSTIICRYCKNIGHDISECRKRQFNNANRFKNNNSQSNVHSVLENIHTDSQNPYENAEKEFLN